jgi:hypothetical protein
MVPSVNEVNGTVDISYCIRYGGMVSYCTAWGRVWYYTAGGGRLGYRCLSYPPVLWCKGQLRLFFPLPHTWRMGGIGNPVEQVPCYPLSSTSREEGMT